jgi:hypothetical protein
MITCSHVYCTALANSCAAAAPFSTGLLDRMVLRTVREAGGLTRTLRPRITRAEAIPRRRPRRRPAGWEDTPDGPHQGFASPCSTISLYHIVGAMLDFPSPTPTRIRKARRASASRCILVLFVASGPWCWLAAELRTRISQGVGKQRGKEYEYSTRVRLRGRACAQTFDAWVTTGWMAWRARCDVCIYVHHRPLRKKLTLGNKHKNLDRLARV